jgi:SAM-dependent methyltransferase
MRPVVTYLGAHKPLIYFDSDMSYRISECPLCDCRDDFAPVVSAKDFHYGNPGEYSLVRCGQCSLCFLSPMYDDAELSSFYPKDYYAYTDRFAAKKFSVLKRLVRSLLFISEYETKDPQFARPGRMLDIGCGSGWFLSKMREKGWTVQGVEPSEAAANLGRVECGLDIFAGSLIDAAFPSESFDYVRLNHSFEHMSNPNSVLEEIYRILAKNGKLMIGVPNRASLNARLFGPYWYHLALPLHPFSYSTKTLKGMLRKHSFKVENVVFNTDNAGIQGSMQFFLNRKDRPLRTEGVITKSRVARVLAIWGAHLENLLHIADIVEITAVKM